ncbi:phage tail fiber protein [Streptomyces sp. RTd22]|uniref:phage tail fiber protein n=1 Tax=Streptomyces sp. RTd22 TaxID=1841249 RepID=UPI00131B99CA|nr:hypothetical protein [Streptomyces sp. RTd22]
MTGGGEDSTSGTDVAADRMLKAHQVRHWGGGALSAPGAWVPKAYLLNFLDQVEAQGSAAVRAAIETLPDDPSGAVYLALCTADPGDIATSLPDEVQAAGYQRQSVSLSAPKLSGQFLVESGVPSQVSLSSSAVFGPFTDSNGSAVAVTHMALVTAATGIDYSVLAVWTLDVPVTASQGESLLAQAGSLTIKVA